MHRLPHIKERKMPKIIVQVDHARSENPQVTLTERVVAADLQNSRYACR